jgi:hypothetical protein
MWSPLFWMRSKRKIASRRARNSCDSSLPYQTCQISGRGCEPGLLSPRSWRRARLSVRLPLSQRSGGDVSSTQSDASCPRWQMEQASAEANVGTAVLGCPPGKARLLLVLVLPLVLSV